MEYQIQTHTILRDTAIGRGSNVDYVIENCNAAISMYTYLKDNFSAKTLSETDKLISERRINQNIVKD